MNYRISKTEKLVSKVKASINIKRRLCYCFDSRKKAIKKNRCLKDIHLGKRCFILGNGPSLKAFDLELLKNEHIFTVNNFYKYSSVLNPEYHVMIDPTFYSKNYVEYIKKIVDNGGTVLTGIDGYDYFGDNEGIIYLYDNLVYRYGKLVLDCSRQMSGCINVVLMAIQCAMYMGFKEIYLLGCDYNCFASPKEKYFYGNVGSDENRFSLGELLNYSAIGLFHHYDLSEIAEKNGIKIINLTPGSLIDAYERENIYNIL